MDPSTTIHLTSQWEQGSTPQPPHHMTHLRQGPVVSSRASKYTLMPHSTGTDEGLKPPEYRSQASYTDLRQVGQYSAPTNISTCTTCGRKRPVIDEGECQHGLETRHATDGGTGEITHLSTREYSNLNQETQPGATTSLVNAQFLPQQPHGINDSRQKKCCRCGKTKKSMPVDRVSSIGATSIMPSPLFSHMNGDHLRHTGQQIQAAQQPPNMPRRKPVPGSSATVSGFEVIPGGSPQQIESQTPTQLAPGNRPMDTSPLLKVERNQGLTVELRRRLSISSITSAISQSFSKRRRYNRDSSNNARYSHGTASSGQHGASHLIDVIVNALRGNEAQPYLNLDGKIDSKRRSASPFSFTGAASEDSTELSALRQPKLIGVGGCEESKLVDQDTSLPTEYSYSDNDQAKPSMGMLYTETMHCANDHDTTDADFTSNRPGQSTRPPERRSLEDGIQRAFSVARSTSLKRLGSLKRAPELWCRNDMAIEGVTTGA